MRHLPSPIFVGFAPGLSQKTRRVRTAMVRLGTVVAAVLIWGGFLYALGILMK